MALDLKVLVVCIISLSPSIGIFSFTLIYLLCLLNFISSTGQGKRLSTVFVERHLDAIISFYAVLGL